MAVQLVGNPLGGEEAVMLALILLAEVGAVSVVGTQSGGMWGGVEKDLQDAGLGS